MKTPRSVSGTSTASAPGTATTPQASKVKQDRRKRIDAVRLVGIACAAYVVLFVLRFANQGAYLRTQALTQLLTQPANWFTALVAAIALVMISIIASRRTLAILAWVATGMIAFQLFHLPSLVLAQIRTILLLGVGLGIPFLFLLEIIATMESGTARARVVFRAKPLGQGILLTVLFMGGIILSFTYLGVLSTYAGSPEAATFQSAMIGGLTTMSLGWIVLARPRQAEVAG